MYVKFKGTPSPDSMITVDLLWDNVVRVEHIIILKCSLVREVVSGDGETGRPGDRSPVYTCGQCGVPYMVTTLGVMGIND